MKALFVISTLTLVPLMIYAARKAGKISWKK